MRLDVRRETDAVVLRCTDDRRGFRTPPRGAALDDGHLGLAACTEHVAAVGGVMEVRSPPAAGPSSAPHSAERTATVSAFL